MDKTCCVVLSALLMFGCFDSVAREENTTDALAGLSAGACQNIGPCQTCVQQGQVAGVHEQSSCRYLGIPYAASTAGAKRFTPPEPAAAWSGVRQAFEYGPGCPQDPDVSFASSLSEDCLSLNVFAPANAHDRSLPVMVFIHGGAFLSGSADLYSGQSLSKAGPVVVVTLNYRLGMLGYLAHPALDRERPGAPSGQDGIRDQQLALRWVQDNIAAFGGDPSNVTVFGESAGSASAHLHMLSPLSRGLAHRYILESGAVTRSASQGISPLTREAGFELARQAAAELCPGARDVIACLRAAPVARLLQWRPAGYDPEQLTVFLPTIDGPDGGVLPDDPDQLMAAGHYNPGELLLGTNKNETALFQLVGSSPTVESSAQLRMLIQERFGPDADPIYALYAPRSVTDDPNQAYVTLMTDITFRCPTRRAARLAAASGTAVYLYSFEQGAAQHVEELAYVLGPNDFGGGLLAPLSFIFSAVLVEATQQYWVNFATRADPNGQQLPVWPRYDATSDQHLVLADPLASGAGLQREACDFWDSYVEQR